MIKSAVIGASGFVGKHLLKSYRTKFPDCIGTYNSQMQEGLTYFNLLNPDLSALNLESQGYKAVIASAANTDITLCESLKGKTPNRAKEVNVDGMIKLIEQVRKTQLKLIFFSTDYAFKGDTGNYDDLDEREPTTEYGKHKVLIEKEIEKRCENYLIIRLSRVFGTDKGDNTIIDDLARKMTNGENVRVAGNQFYCITHIKELIQAIHLVQKKDLSGKMNICGYERWSRYEIALALQEEFKKRGITKLGEITEIDLYDIPSLVGRPLETSLTCSKLKKYGFNFRPISESISKVVDNYT